MEGLKKILESFEGVYKSTARIQDKEKDLSNQFESLAKQIFYKGHFETDYGIQIYPIDIEFYYHEDAEDGLKDPIMYHTNDRLTDDNVKKVLGNEYPYFKKCALHFHTSGIDVTFEEPDKYRASFLIRGYEVRIAGEKIVTEDRPTYIYDYIFIDGFVNGKDVLVWKSDDDSIIEHPEMKICARENVHKYKMNGDKYEKDSHYRFIRIENSKCDRQWRFIK